MSLGRIFKSMAAAQCGACSKEIELGAEVTHWDDVLVHVDCVPEDVRESEDEREYDDDASDDQMLVFRGHDGRPVAVPHDVAYAAERPLRAYELKQTGMSWRQVALQENYPNGDAARLDVARYLKEGASLVADFTKKELLAMDVERLESLLRFCWSGASQGNPQLIGQAHGIVMSHVKLLRLDGDTGEDEGNGKGGTVIVPADEEGYSKALEKIGNRKAG